MPLFEDETTRRANEEHQLDIDFDSAMYKAFKEELKGFLLRKSRRLLPFELVKDKLEIWFARNMGIQTVPIENIVGSEGRYRSFTRQFLPLQEDLRDRWKKVNQAHKYYLEKTNAEKIPFPEAACSWYDKLYEPFVSAIRKNGIMKRFRHRTETDFYLWVIKNRRKLIEAFVENEEAENLVEAYAWKYSGPFRKIIGAFKRFFGLIRY